MLVIPALKWQRQEDCHKFEWNPVTKKKKKGLLTLHTPVISALGRWQARIRSSRPSCPTKPVPDPSKPEKETVFPTSKHFVMSQNYWVPFCYLFTIYSIVPLFYFSSICSIWTTFHSLTMLSSLWNDQCLFPSRPEKLSRLDTELQIVWLKSFPGWALPSLSVCPLNMSDRRLDSQLSP